MFVCMSLDSFMPEEENDQSSSTELSVLLILSAAWHLVCILWWLMWIGSSVFDVYNIWYHFFIVIIQCTSLTGWRMIVRSGIYIKHKELCEWCGAAWYALVTIIIYCTRMIYYVNSLPTAWKRAFFMLKRESCPCWRRKASGYLKTATDPNRGEVFFGLATNQCAGADPDMTG